MIRTQTILAALTQRNIILAVAWFASLLIALRRPADSWAQEVLAFRNAQLVTMEKEGTIDGGTLVLIDGKIEALGKDVDIPDTAKVIDGRGMTILPGFVDPYRVVNLAAASAGPPQTITVGGQTIQIRRSAASSSGGFVRIADSLDVYSGNYEDETRSGITLMQLVTRGMGQSALATVVRGGSEKVSLQPDGLMFTALTNSSSSLDVIRNGLSRVKKAEDAKKKAAAGGAKPASSAGARATRPPSTASRSASSGTAAITGPLWEKIYKGEQRVVINCNNAATILHLKKILKDYEKVKVILIATGANLYETMDQLDAKRMSLLIAPTIDNVPYTRNRVNIAAVANKKKVPFAFSLAMRSFELVASQDSPLVPVAFLVKTGLPRQAALEALTIRPAQMLGIEKEYGSLKKGKSASIVVFDGDPLDPASRVRRVVVKGKTVYEH